MMLVVGSLATTGELLRLGVCNNNTSEEANLDASGHREFAIVSLESCEIILGLGWCWLVICVVLASLTAGFEVDEAQVFRIDRPGTPEAIFSTILGFGISRGTLVDILRSLLALDIAGGVSGTRIVVVGVEAGKTGLGFTNCALLDCMAFKVAFLLCVPRCVPCLPSCTVACRLAGLTVWGPSTGAALGASIANARMSFEPSLTFLFIGTVTRNFAGARERSGLDCRFFGGFSVRSNDSNTSRPWYFG
mmetsp:Transcript_7779/g.14354  ORF Transcript_7779/g.14354 Transcript_7779/m.14354 type:complete len:248 (-) Transcript_7779:2392-3135(-)